MESTLLHSSDYNLRFVCPNILMYKNRYSDYINDTYTFKTEENFLLEYFKIEDPTQRLSAFSAFISFSIINNFLLNRKVIKKDIEFYYNSQMLSFIKKSGDLSQFQLKSLALTWNSISKTIDLLLDNLKKYSAIKIDYKVQWSDVEFNYQGSVPIIGINENETVDIYLILQTSFEKYPLYSNDIDYLRIPSNVRLLNYFISQNLDIQSLKILWIDSSDINQRFKFSEYKGISKTKVKDFIRNNSDILNFKTNSLLRYNNLNQCYSCPYFMMCSTSNSLLSNTRIPYKQQKNNNHFETLI